MLLDRNTGLRPQAQATGLAFDAGGPEAFTVALREAFGSSVFPAGLEVRLGAEFFPESRELLVDCELPRQNVVPTMTGYRYIQRTDEIRPDPRKDAEIKRLYRDLVARTPLRILAETFDATPPPLVDSVIINGFGSAKDRATGQPIRPCIISVEATRELMGGLVLDEPELDPAAVPGPLARHRLAPPGWQRQDIT